jgi:hypothetical protein
LRQFGGARGIGAGERNHLAARIQPESRKMDEAPVIAADNSDPYHECSRGDPWIWQQSRASAAMRRPKRYGQYYLSAMKFRNSASSNAPKCSWELNSPDLIIATSSDGVANSTATPGSGVKLSIRRSVCKK